MSLYWRNITLSSSTVATPNMAAKWKDFERNKDLYPNLKYVTAGDNRVREKHAQWDGLVLPIEHDFCKKNLPPNDWGCRCSAVQTDEEVSKDKPSAKAKPGFDNNAAMSGDVFPEIPYEKGMSKEAVKKAKNFADKMIETLDRYAANYGIFLKLRLDKNYTDVKFNAKTGGMKATHKEHKFDKVRGHYEKEVQDLFVKNGELFTLEAEAYASKQVEGFLNEATIEIKTIFGNSWVTLKKRIVQSVAKGAEITLLYFPENYNPALLKKALEEYVGKPPKIIRGA